MDDLKNTLTCCSPKKSESETNCCNDKKFNKVSIGYPDVSNNKIPVISTKIAFKDKLDDLKVRWNFGRMNYSISPGLYAVGSPAEAPLVLVTANYKLTVNTLRKELEGLNVWLLILDTKGINVWCAAGKGTFGTDELLNRIELTGLINIVKNPVLILPQLGAAGVAAFTISQKTGIKIIYGPVYARDIREFISNGLKKKENMKIINFNLKERLEVIPVELTQTMPLVISIFIFSILTAFIQTKALNIQVLFEFIPLIGSVITGCILTPVFLPYIPFKSFALKGAVTGLIWAVIIGIIFKFTFTHFIISTLLITAISAYLSLNFTGASTFTSVTGAKFEVKIALPFILFFLILGVILKILLAFKIVL